MSFQAVHDDTFQLLCCAVTILDDLRPHNRQPVICGFDHSLSHRLPGQKLDELFPLLGKR